MSQATEPGRLTVPEVQAALLRLAGSLRMGIAGTPHEVAAELERLEAQLPRKPRATNGPVTSARMTPALVRKILETRRLHPYWNQLQIAIECGVNPGRVSEVLAGKRGAAAGGASGRGR